MPAHEAEITHQGLSIEGLGNISRKTRNRCCFPDVNSSTNYSSTQAGFVSFEEILWIEPLGNHLYSLQFARKTDEHEYVPSRIQISIVHSSEQHVQNILDQAYDGIVREKRLLVLINPHGGQGKAERIYKKHGAPFFAAARCRTEVIVTSHRYHAQEIAQSLDLQKYDGIVCCSGDGIPHEVLNGLALRPDATKALAHTPICQFPCGSGNSMAMSITGSGSPSNAALSIIKGKPMRVDLMYLTQGDKKAISFLSQTYGLVADCDLGTENLRWMGGQRFTFGAIMKTLSKAQYPCTLSVKYAHEQKSDVIKHFNQNKPTVGGEGTSSSKKHTDVESGVLPEPSFGTVNNPLPSDWTTIDLPKLNFFYAGKMPWMATNAFVFPATLPTDGYLDLITWEGTIGRFKSLELLLQIEEGKHFHSDLANYCKVEAYRLTPNISHGYVSIDGEAFKLEPFQVEVMPAAGCFLSHTGRYVNTSDL